MTERDPVADLVARLRDCANGIGSFRSDAGDFGLCDEAAATIERLTREKTCAEDAYFRAWDAYFRAWHERDAQRRRAEAAETALAKAQDQMRDVAERMGYDIETLRSELAKAREALEFFAKDDNWRLNGPLDPNSGNFIGRIHARAALAPAKPETEGE